MFELMKQMKVGIEWNCVNVYVVVESQPVFMLLDRNIAYRISDIALSFFEIFVELCHLWCKWCYRNGYCISVCRWKMEDIALQMTVVILMLQQNVWHVYGKITEFP